MYETHTSITLPVIFGGTPNNDGQCGKRKGVHVYRNRYYGVVYRYGYIGIGIQAQVCFFCIGNSSVNGSKNDPKELNSRQVYPLKMQNSLPIQPPAQDGVVSCSTYRFIKKGCTQGVLVLYQEKVRIRDKNYMLESRPSQKSRIALRFSSILVKYGSSWNYVIYLNVYAYRELGSFWLSPIHIQRTADAARNDPWQKRLPIGI